VKSSEAPATGKRRTMTVQIGVILDDKKAHVVYSCCSGQVPLLKPIQAAYRRILAAFGKLGERGG